MRRILTEAEWNAEGHHLFGHDQMKWKFLCPSCGMSIAVTDWKEAGAPENAVAFSCVGRWRGGDNAKTFAKKGGPCTYAGGGLFAINPVRVHREDGSHLDVFEFACPHERLNEEGRCRHCGEDWGG